VEGVSRIMSMTMMKMAGAIALAVGLAATGAGVWAGQKDQARQGAAPSPPARRPTEQGPAIVARVGGKPITRDEWIERCLEKHGARELETLVNRMVLRQECERHGITVTDDEVAAEALRITQRLGISPEHWYRTLREQRDLSEVEYVRNLASQLMMNKLQGAGLATSFDELKSKARVEIFVDQPRDHGRGAEQAPAAARSREDRLRDVERKLEQAINALEDLRREVGR
jgi:foldase protein PrsA